MAQTVKNLPTMQETWVQSLGQEDPLEKEMATPFLGLRQKPWLPSTCAGDLRGASHGGSEKSGKLEVGGASRDSTGFGALEEGLISS